MFQLRGGRLRRETSSSLLKKGTDRSVHAERAQKNQQLARRDRVVCPLFQQAPSITSLCTYGARTRLPQ